MRITAASPDAIAAITAIYAHHVIAGTGTFEEVAPDQPAMAARLQAGTSAGFPWLIATDDSGVLGFGYYGPFRARSAYGATVEDSVYVRDDVRGQGVGKAILAALIAHAKAANLKQMLALIGDSENIGSIGAHASLGFRQAGVLRDVGFKFGRWLDVVIMQLTLQPGSEHEAPP